LVHFFLRDHPAGCCLHIVLDDGNLKDEDVRHCQHVAIDHRHPDCVMIAMFLYGLSPTQRRAFLRVRRGR
jgi:hypothetical protein